MGICSSCDATNVATAKLILLDGRLQEFAYPVKASYVLQKHPACFICNSDEMEFDDVVSAINGDEKLLPGQLYFALPLSRLSQPLQPEEMAALAVKASAALMKSGHDKCGCRRRKTVSPSELPEEGRRSYRRVDNASGGGCQGNSRRKFTAMLGAIPE